MSLMSAMLFIEVRVKSGGSVEAVTFESYPLFLMDSCQHSNIFFSDHQTRESRVE